jgi:site-specific recombinase XerD
MNLHLLVLKADRYFGERQPGAAVFQTWNKNHRLTGQAISRRDMLRIVKERCAAAELPESICNHTFRGTGITVFLQNGGSLEAAQDMANHTDPRTTKLDRRIAFE